MNSDMIPFLNSSFKTALSPSIIRFCLSLIRILPSALKISFSIS
ncbi:Unknown [Rickettsia africae ESF-5]|uniref:Uncharacterized protein n=1 Tax=Rickettsia africae (strain ESF-5) TaxID=347255 RepID=C3PPC6_RICAE|nr:Unknown [Rickettsia africae ESF-5]